MIHVSGNFPAVTIMIPTAGLARYVSFEMSMEQLHVPETALLHRGISANLAAPINEAIAETRTPLVWFMDDDHQFDPGLLLRLIAHDLPVVVPTTGRARIPFQPVLVRDTVTVGGWEHFEDVDQVAAKIASLRADGYVVQAEEILRRAIERGTQTRPKQLFRHYSWDELDRESGLFQLKPPGGRCGRAGLLVKREVFDAIPAPWFDLGQCNPEELNEDYHFIEKVHAAGFPVYVDLEATFGHIAPCIMTPVRDHQGRWAMKLEWETTGLSIMIPRWEPPVLTHNCLDGWVCEQHPDLPLNHTLPIGRCAGKARACPVSECSAWTRT